MGFFGFAGYEKPFSALPWLSAFGEARYGQHGYGVNSGLKFTF